MKFDRSVWIFLIVGIALRCTAINQPLVDAHLLRQCQTAAATRSLMEETSFYLSSRIPWIGDLEGRYLQELPIYNFLVIGVHLCIPYFDLSGKVTSIILWAASFICLQLIWRRVLDSRQTFWANLLFVIAPFSVFYGQAFMPEMLVQTLGFAFVLLAIRYVEAPSLLRWTLCAAIGLTGLLTKFPEISHLYFILMGLIFAHEGFKAVRRPRYWIAGLLTIVAVKVWSNYMDAVNVGPLSFGSSQEKLQVFIGTLGSRFHLKSWAMVSLYLGTFVVPGPAALVTIYGAWTFVRKQRQLILGLWLGSLIIFYLVWFGTVCSQGYYNLPAIAPLCALFGFGMREILVKRWFESRRQAMTICAALLVVLPAIPIWKYLFKQDRQILAAALWAKQNTAPTDIVLFWINHRFDMSDYPENPVPPYCSERRAFIWTKTMPAVVAQRALNRASYVIVTIPPPPVNDALAIVNRLRGKKPPLPESMEWLKENGFRSIIKQAGLEVYRKE